MVTSTLLKPSLENGDHLDRDEFWRRYELNPGIKKAEWIRGVVYVASPVRSPNHAIPHAMLIAHISSFVLSHPEVIMDDNATLRLEHGDVQPDVMLSLSPLHGGRTRADERRYVTGSPELCAEIASSSASYDMHEKKELYREAGVQEYIVWRVDDEAIDWFELHGGEYVPLTADADGLTRSRVLPGLALNLPAILEAADAAMRMRLGLPPRDAPDS
jgi:Uma2 family endonuclease